tara:strand:- start:330 stop:899 length:570 start_codon:yes stop_codon:yes gene_type:complete
MNVNKAGSYEKYKLTNKQIKLLKNELRYDKAEIESFVEKVLSKHILFEKGKFKDMNDYIIEEDLQKIHIEYILNKNNSFKYKNIDKYNISNYYYNLAQEFNDIASKRKLNRKELWNNIKENLKLEKFNKSELRLYKYIFRGEVVSSPKYVYNSFQRFGDLRCYRTIIKIVETQNKKLTNSYKKLYESIF